MHVPQKYQLPVWKPHSCLDTRGGDSLPFMAIESHSFCTGYIIIIIIFCLAGTRRLLQDCMNCYRLLLRWHWCYGDVILHQNALEQNKQWRKNARSIVLTQTLSSRIAGETRLHIQLWGRTGSGNRVIRNVHVKDQSAVENSKTVGALTQHPKTNIQISPIISIVT